MQARLLNAFIGPDADPLSFAQREGLDIRLIQAAQGAAEPPWPVTSP